MTNIIRNDIVRHLNSRVFQRELQKAGRDFFQALGVLAKEARDARPAGEQNGGAAKRGDRQQVL